MKKSVEVVAAIITFDNEFLCVQRGKGKYDYISYKYEFPGGKVEKGETEEEAITREIKEELHMDITISEKFISIEHEYDDFHIVMHSFICLVSKPDLVLEEHVDYKWLKKEKLDQLDWAAADIPIVEQLMK